jgi:mevalonate kinase
VSTPGVQGMFSDRRFRRRVSGAKLCGAGGGGMLFGLLRDPGDRVAVETLLSGAGMSVLPFRLSGGPRFEELRKEGK